MKFQIDRFLGPTEAYISNDTLYTGSNECAQTLIDEVKGCIQLNTIPPSFLTADGQIRSMSNFAQQAFEGALKRRDTIAAALARVDEGTNTMQDEALLETWFCSLEEEPKAKEKKKKA